MRMKTRTIKELLQVLLDNEKYFKHGLCGMRMDMRVYGVIDSSESNVLKDFLIENLPCEKYYSPKYIALAYSFPYGEWQPRKQWLEQEINKL